MSKNTIFLFPIVIFLLTIILPFGIDDNSNLATRIVVIGTYLSVISFAYSLKKVNRIDWINMSTKFDKSNEVYAKEYLKYFFNSSVIIFGIASFLTLMFFFLQWPLWLDIYFSIVSCFLWSILTYKKSREIMKSNNQNNLKEGVRLYAGV